MRPTILAQSSGAARARRHSVLSLALVAIAGAGTAACADDAGPLGSESVVLDREGAGVVRQYGVPTALGQGRVRTYVVLDSRSGGRPLEVGVAFDERAMEGLPTAGSGHQDGHGHIHTFNLPLPPQHASPFRFVELNWNPAGHEPEGVYTLPHFDFHFYTITQAERDAILPSDPLFMQKSANLPAVPFVAPFYVPLAAPGAPIVAIPQMGVHWSDVRSPELQALLGNPGGYQPFTKTFIYGSYDGRFIFAEPMITRAHIMAKRTTLDAAVRDETIPVPTAAQYAPAGSYPGAYRILYDAQAKEYRIGLTQLAPRS